MAKIHITLQGKGGVGKSFISVLRMPEKSIMTRQSLKIVRDQLFGQLDSARVI